MTEATAQFADQGFLVVPGFLSPHECDQVAAALPNVADQQAGTRNLLGSTWCHDLAHRLKALAVLSPLLPARAVAVQCTLFDKTKDKNWLVALHQDLSIPVAERVPEPSCSGWNEKEGTLFVQPPVAVLEGMVAVRVHLDPCGTESGPLRVVPGSHRQGRVPPEVASVMRSRQGELECLVPMGGLLVLRPLLLHASSKARSPVSRRVLHFLFGPAELPCGLRWRHAT